MGEKDCDRHIVREAHYRVEMKVIYLILRKCDEGAELRNVLLVYNTICFLENKFGINKIRNYTEIIRRHSGVNRDCVPKAINKLEELKAIKKIVIRDKYTKMIKRSYIVLTPERIVDYVKEKQYSLNENEEYDDI